MKTKSLIVLTAAVAMVFFGCQEPAYINAPGDNSQNTETIPIIAMPDPVDPEGFILPEGCLNVYEAIHISDTLGSGKTSTEKYYIKGWVRQFDAKYHESGMQQYGNGTFYIAATPDGRSDRKMFEAYQVYGKDGKKFTSLDQIALGDFVVIYGQITNYNNIAETPGKGAAYVYASTNENFDPKIDQTKITPDPEGANVPEGCLNVYEALHISDSIGSGKATAEEYYVKGWISSLHSQNESGITGNYHNATFFIAPTNDGTTNATTFEAYRVKGPNNSNITDVNQVKVGDFVVLRCKIKNYNGTAENDNNGYIYYSSNPLLQ